MRIGNNAYWKDEFDLVLKDARTFEELVPVALDIIGHMMNPVSIVCGPVASGGEGDEKENLENLNKTIRYLYSCGHNVFNLVPFEEPVRRIKKLERYEETPGELFTKFYDPLFKSGLIAKAFFIHDWKTSKGAAWQHCTAKEAGIAIKVLFPDLIKINV